MSIPDPSPRAPASRIDVDRHAPVVSHEELVIDAPVDVVWALHTDVDAWPSWRADVASARLAGPFTVGAAFAWQTAGLDITSTISEVTTGSRTVWGGPANGIDGVHVWEFARHGNGVLVRTTESWDGEPVRADVAALQAALDQSLRVWLRDLRAAAGRAVSAQA